MGADKASVKIGHQTMAEWVATALKPQVSEAVVVGREKSLAGLESIPDAWRGPRGPLAGVATALRRFRAPLIVVAVDQPLLRPQTVGALVRFAASNQAAIPRDDALQVTCATYPADWEDVASRTLASGGSLRDLISSMPHAEVPETEWARWGEDGRSWFSFDTEDAILVAERRFRVDLAAR